MNFFSPFENRVIDNSFKRFLIFSVIFGLIISAIEIIGFYFIGSFIDSKRGGTDFEYPLKNFIRAEILIVIVFFLKLLASLIFVPILNRFNENLLTTLAKTLIHSHISFNKGSSEKEGDVSNMVNNCLTQVMFLDGNLMRQLILIIQETILALIVLFVLIKVTSLEILVFLLFLLLVLVSVKQTTKERFRLYGDNVVIFNEEVTKFLIQIHNLRNELNVWNKLKFGSNKVLIPYSGMLKNHFKSEAISLQLRPLLELLSVGFFIALIYYEFLPENKIVLIGILILRLLPSLAKIQLSFSIMSKAYPSLNRLKKVLSWMD